MPPRRGVAFRSEGLPENGSAAPTANRNGANSKVQKLGASPNRYEPRSGSSTGKKPGPTKKQTVDERFAGETPAQRAQHRAIAWRYSWDDRDQPDRRRPNAWLNRCMRELERLWASRYLARELADDDSGRGDLFIAANLLAQFGDPNRHIPAWVRQWAPWLSDADLTKLISRVVRKPVRWTAASLGKALRLTQEERKRHRIRTFRAFDVSDEDMKLKRTADHANGERARRRAAGAVNRAEYEAASAARKEPWRAFGISRATYYRRLKAGKVTAGTSPGTTDATVPHGAVETETGPCAAEFKILLGTHLSHEHPGTVPGVIPAKDAAQASPPAAIRIIHERRTVIDGRSLPLALAPASTDAGADNLLFPNKTVVVEKEEDCPLCLKGIGTEALSQPCPCPDADGGRP